MVFSNIFQKIMINHPKNKLKQALNDTKAVMSVALEDRKNFEKARWKNETYTPYANKLVTTNSSKKS